MDKIELKPCPFCGGKAKFKVKYYNSTGYAKTWSYEVACEICGATDGGLFETAFSFGFDGTIELVCDQRESAANRWNKRVEP